MTDDEYGYLLVHFRDEPHGERVFFSLSDGDDPLRWHALDAGRPRLTNDVGTRGARDPAIVRDASGRYHVMATDLKVEADGAGRWDQWVRTGSRNLVVWDSDDLVTWTKPRLVEVAPPTAGMAWAPEITTDPETGDHIVFWSSRLYEADDPGHVCPSYSRILYARTRDFVSFTPAEVLIDTGADVIDTAIVHVRGKTHRIGKDEDSDDAGRGVHHEVGSGLFADDYRTLAVRIGRERHRHLEGPIVFRDHREDHWYLFLDQYSTRPQGYVAFETDDLESGRWSVVESDRFHLSPGTKHGGILSLTRAEWDRLAHDVAPPSPWIRG